jgi:hypothetical protein
MGLVLCTCGTLGKVTLRTYAPSRLPTVMGFNGMTILYGHYYFHQDRVFLTHAFATSTTPSPLGMEANHVEAPSSTRSQVTIVA